MLRPIVFWFLIAVALLAACSGPSPTSDGFEDDPTGTPSTTAESESTGGTEPEQPTPAPDATSAPVETASATPQSATPQATPTELPNVDAPTVTTNPELPTETATTEAPAPTATTPQEAATPDPESASVRFQEVTAGFIEPTLLTHPGDGSGTVYVTEKRGRIYTLDGRLFLDITDRVINTGLAGNARELGFLGLAFHPEFESNDLFYVHYNDLDGDSVISEFKAGANGTGDPQSERVLLAFDQPEDHFNGGTILFGPDGYLYIATGTGGGRPQDFANAQDLGSLYGKILRIDVDSGDSYGIPADNPYVETPDARPEVWAYGLRNPWRIAFDSVTGDIFIAEPGQFGYEWVHHQGAEPGGAPPGGVNYGWPVYEGFHCFDIPSGTASDSFSCQPPPDYKPPIFEYPRGQDGGCVIIGGSVYRGPAIPALQGAYLYSDFCSGVVSVAWMDGAGEWQTMSLADLPGLVSSFGEDSSGEVYVMNISEGVIYKMVPA